MPLKLSFDSAGTIQTPTIVLAYKSGEKINAIPNVTGLVVTDSFGNPIELSFSVRKKDCGKLWKEIIDFRSIWVAEWDKWFEIHIDINESTNSLKSVYAMHLPEAELSQLNLYNVEINTEDDIDRDDYEETVFCNNKNHNASLLHRVTGKAVNFVIDHVDESLMNIQRTFSFDGKSIYDCLLEIAEEINCVFLFDIKKDLVTGKMVRTISAYDLLNSCNECGYREENITVCPKCGSKNITPGYGEDTTVFLSLDNALDDISYTSDKDSVKNCFKLEGGDDDITAAVMNCNPNGSDTIWHITDEMKLDMSDALCEKLDRYFQLEDEYVNSIEYGNSANYPLDLSTYNNIVGTYSADPFNNPITTTAVPVVGHSNLMRLYYDTIDMWQYLTSGMMPTPTMIDTTSSAQATKIKNEISSVAVSSDAGLKSESTVKSSVKALAEAICDPRYDIEVTSTSLQNSVWTGTVKVTNKYDEEETTTVTLSNIPVTTDYETFVKQKLDKALGKCEDTDYSISGLFKLGQNVFVNELKKYGKNSLERFRDSCSALINVLTEQGVGNPDMFIDPNNNLYTNLYTPYMNKLQAIEAEIKVREDQITVIEKVQEQVESICSSISEKLNMESYLGSDLWAELNLFRREDKYSNSNFVSDGTDNVEIFRLAGEFLEAAKKELLKASSIKHSVSITLKNIFTNNAFKPMRSGFSVGNWIRIEVDERVHKLRLLSYELNFDDYENMSVEFSDVEKVGSDTTSIQKLLNNMNTISTTYSYVEHQAGKGSESANIVSRWFSTALDMTATKIVNSATEQSQTWDGNGMLFRRGNDITGEYDPEQIKIINSTIAITNDAWKTVKTAIGKFIYYDPVSGTYKEGYGVNGEVLTGRVIIGQNLVMANGNNTLLFDENGMKVTNGINTVTVNPNDPSVFRLSHNNEDVIYFDETGGAVFRGSIQLGSSTISTDNITGLSKVATSGSYNDLGNKPDLTVYATTTSVDTKLKEYAKTGVLVDYLKTSDLNAELGNLKVAYRGDVTTTQEILDGGIIKTISNYTGKDGTVYSTTTYTASDSDYVLIGRDNKWGNGETAGDGVNLVKISKDGLLTANNALIHGTIYATDGDFVGNITAKSLTLGTGVTISSGSVTGLSKVATSGSYSDLSNTPYIPQNVTDLVGGSNILYTSNVQISSAITVDGLTKQTVTVGNTSFTVFQNNNFILWENAYGTDTSDGSKSYTYIAKDGALTAKNAVIWGNIHATNGYFNGEVVATNLTATQSGTIGCWSINKDAIYSSSSTFGNANGMYFGINGLSVKDKFTVDSSGNAFANNFVVGNNIYVKDTYNNISSKVLSYEYIMLEGKAENMIRIGDQNTSGNYLSLDVSTIMTTAYFQAWGGLNVSSDFSASCDGSFSGNVSAYNFFENEVSLSDKYSQKSHIHAYLEYYNSDGINVGYRVFLNGNKNFIPCYLGGGSDEASQCPGEIDIGSSVNYYGNVNYGGSLSKRSDRRDKNDIGNLSLEESKNILLNLKLKKFTYKRDSMQNINYGIFAQDLRDLLIETNIGHISALSICKNDTEEYIKDLSTPEEIVSYSVDYTQFIPLLIKVYQDSQEKINELEEKIKKLESR